jgi:hypothetical protein
MTAEIVLMLHKAPFFHPSSELIKANAAKGAQPVACQVRLTQKLSRPPFPPSFWTFGVCKSLHHQSAARDFEDTKHKLGGDWKISSAKTKIFVCHWISRTVAFMNWLAMPFILFINAEWLISNGMCRAHTIFLSSYVRKAACEDEEKESRISRHPTRDNLNENVLGNIWAPSRSDGNKKLFLYSTTTKPKNSYTDTNSDVRCSFYPVLKVLSAGEPKNDIFQEIVSHGVNFLF